MNEGTLARRYAKALFALAGKQSNIDAVFSELEGFAALLSSSLDLSMALSDPVFEVSERQKVLSALFDRLGYSATTRSFLTLLVDRKRMTSFPVILLVFQGLVDDFKRRVRVLVESAVSLSDEQLSILTATLQKSLACEVLLQSKVDPELIAGLRVQIADRVLDGTVRAQLNRMKQKITDAVVN